MKHSSEFSHKSARCWDRTLNRFMKADLGGLFQLAYRPQKRLTFRLIRGQVAMAHTLVEFIRFWGTQLLKFYNKRL